jgi:uracil-DNA glycosylase
MCELPIAKTWRDSLAEYMATVAAFAVGVTLAWPATTLVRLVLVTLGFDVYCLCPPAEIVAKVYPEWFRDVRPHEIWDRLRWKPRPVCPPTKLVLEAYRWLKPDQVRVAIVGQDPYPQLPDACGVAFQALNRVPNSAASIFDNLLKYGHMTVAQRGAMQAADLRGWLGQSVLLVNVGLTVRDGAPGSHLMEWDGITERFLASLPKKSVALLLGEHAGRLALPCMHVIRHSHPVIPSVAEFQKFDCFGAVNATLRDLGLAPIVWARHA